MRVATVLVSTVHANLGIFDVDHAAGVISEMSGADAGQVARDLRGGITFECDGFTFMPDAIAERDTNNRVTARLSLAQRTPAWPGGAS